MMSLRDLLGPIGAEGVSARRPRRKGVKKKSKDKPETTKKRASARGRKVTTTAKDKLVLDADRKTIMELEIDQIRVDEDLQSRAEMNEEVITEYAELYRRGVNLPPVRVMRDGDSYWLFDGFHRIEALTRVGEDRVTCEVIEGTWEDARWASCAANQTHGLRRTNADKARAVMRALTHPKRVTQSDRAIGEHVGVDQKTVSKYRKELETTGEIPQLKETTGMDGKKRRRPAQPRPDDATKALDADSEPLLCPCCEIYDCDSGNDRCSRCIATNRTFDDDMSSAADDDVEVDVEDAVEDELDDTAAHDQQATPALLQLTPQIRQAINIEKAQLATMDADLRAEIAATARRLAAELSEFAEIAELGAAPVVNLPQRPAEEQCIPDAQAVTEA
jgi:hypothetical protein